MQFVADILLLAGALTAALYCWVLSARVKGLKDLDSGLGSAIAALSSQVSEMQDTLKATQKISGASVAEMKDLSKRAEAASERLQLLLATVHEDKQEPARKSPSIKKFPAKKASQQKQKESEHENVVAEIDDYQDRVPKTRAEKLRNEVAEKLLDRDNTEEREELVRALQSILATNK